MTFSKGIFWARKGNLFSNTVRFSVSVIPKWICFGNTLPMIKNYTCWIFCLYSIVLVSSVVRFPVCGKKYPEVTVWPWTLHHILQQGDLRQEIRKRRCPFSLKFWQCRKWEPWLPDTPFYCWIWSWSCTEQFFGPCNCLHVQKGDREGSWLVFLLE